MIILGSVSAAFLLVGTVPGVVLTAPSIASNHAWAIFAAAALGASAVLNTLAVVPLSSVARDLGSKYTFRIGLISAAVYWGTVLILTVTSAPLWVPIAPLLASVVGLVGNLMVLKVVRVHTTSSPQDASCA